MFVRQIFHERPDYKREDGHVVFSHRDGYRGYMSDYHLARHGDRLKSIQPKGKAALIYVVGSGEHHSNQRIYPKLSMPSALIPIKSQLATFTHKIAYTIGNISDIRFNSNTCASGMYALHEAQMLLNSGYDEVIVYGEEWVEEVEIELFRQLGIDMPLGDAFAYVVLTNEPTDIEISETEVAFTYESHPMKFNSSGYQKVLQNVPKRVDIFKPHFSGNKQSDVEEIDALNVMGIDYGTLVSYKHRVGHTQGVSALIEMAMLIEEKEFGTALMMASGMGGFYGSAVLTKRA